MLDLLIIREQLRAVRDEIALTEEARAWAEGTYRPSPGAILPMPASSEGWMAWGRALSRVPVHGPRIVAAYVTSAIHDVNWGGESLRLDRRLVDLDLVAIARRLAVELVTTGIAGGYVYEHETMGLRIGLLGGHLRPYLDPMDRDVVTGIYQAARTLRPGRPPRWWVRVWDVETREVREWAELDDPAALATPPPRVIPGLVPRVRWWELTESGLPTGPVIWAIPILRAIMAIQLMMARVEELAGYPVPVFGETTEPQEVGPGLPIRGQFRWERPGSLEELRAQLELYTAQLRDLLALPGGALGTQTPSGEALREANVRFRAAVSYLSGTVAALLSELVADYADAIGVEAPPVSVVTAPDLQREDHISRIISLYREGLIPIRAALMEIQPYVPMLTDELLEQHARRLEGVSSPEQLVTLLGG